MNGIIQKALKTGALKQSDIKDVRQRYNPENPNWYYHCTANTFSRVDTLHQNLKAKNRIEYSQVAKVFIAIVHYSEPEEQPKKFFDVPLEHKNLASDLYKFLTWFNKKPYVRSRGRREIIYDYIEQEIKN